MVDADETWTGEGPAAAAPAGPTLLAGRYRLGAPLGRGGSSQVYQARDELVGDEVAVKLVTGLGPGPARQLRRELAALLLLRLPGVVQLRDEGVVGLRTFLVTERVEGRPFSALAARGGWEVWREPLVALLDTLARVHLAGVIHRDLKPGNVLVDAEGRVWVLDFGLAQGRAIEAASGGPIEGTPRYMAPEQRAGRPCDERTDLYAVGAMVVELACGAPPTGRVAEAVLERALPGPVAAVVARMCAEDPEDRPASALEVMAALGRNPVPELVERVRAPCTAAALEPLFVDRAGSFTWLAKDAAALLLARGGGDPARTRSELEGWLRAGLASWSGGRVLIDRAAIEQIRAMAPGSPQARLAAMLESGAPIPRVTAEARRVAARLYRRGAVFQALAVLDAAELWARETGELGGLLEDRVHYALSLDTPVAVDRAAYHVRRAELAPGLQGPLLDLLEAARAALGGETERPAEILGDAAPAGLSEPVQRCWHGIRCRVAERRPIAHHEAVIDELRRWAAAHPGRPARWQWWLGLLRYRQERFVEAARMFLQAADGLEAVLERATVLYLASGALLEAGDLAAARDHARRALRLVVRARNPRQIGRVWFILRTIHYRRGRLRPARPGLVEAAADLHPATVGRLALVEAAIAWRRGEAGVAVPLAETAVRALRRAGGGPALDLAEALAVVLGAEAVDVDALAARAAEAAPDIGIQVLGLLASTGERRPGWQQQAAQLVAALSGRDAEARLDLVSIREAATFLGVPD